MNGTLWEVLDDLMKTFTIVITSQSLLVHLVVVTFLGSCPSYKSSYSKTTLNDLMGDNNNYNRPVENTTSHHAAFPYTQLLHCMRILISTKKQQHIFYFILKRLKFLFIFRFMPGIDLEIFQ